MTWDRTASVHYWAARFLEDDTILALRLLALTGIECPELAELYRLLDRIDLLLQVHVQRLQGAAIRLEGTEYLVIPLPDL